MGLKRHPALQPFSRDHLIGLFHAQRLIKLNNESEHQTVSETINAFADAWQREISVHFADEDRLLAPLPISAKSRERLHNEHVDLTSAIEHLLQNQLSIFANEVGALLDAHIRWEEHELFPEIESTLPDNALADLGKETELVEKSRHRKLL